MSQNVVAEKPRTSTIAVMYPYLLLVIAGAGLGLTIYLKRPELSVFSLIWVVPLVLAAFVLIIRRNAVTNPAALPALADRVSFGNLFWAGMLVFIISLIVLVANTTRPPAYFVLVSIFAAIILWQIMAKRPAWTNNLILIEIVALSLSLTWGVSLKYPLYFGDTDLLPHFHFIETILQTGYVDPNIFYQHYPLYHIFAASGVEVTGISIRTSVFILMGVAWQISIVLAYLIFRNLSKSSKLALVGCLLFASSSQLIFYGSYAIARSLAFVFLVCWIYLVINKAQNDRRYLFLSLIVMGAMIVTHHLNVLFVIPAMALVYICQLVIKRSGAQRLVNPIFIYLVTVCAISYLLWAAADLAGDSLPITIRNILSADMTIGGDVTHGYGLPVIFGALYYSFILLLCLLGMRSFMISSLIIQKRYLAAAFALAGLVMLVLFVPGPLDLLSFSQTILTARLQLLVSPFIMFLAAFGIKYLFDLVWAKGIQAVRLSISAIIPIGLVALTVFFSTISTGNAKDTDYLPHTTNIDTPYFTTAELNSFSFLNERLDPNLPFYSDYETMRNDFTLNKLDNRIILRSGDITSLSEGYLMLRAGELERKKALTFTSTGNAADNYRYYLDSSNPQNNILTNLQSRIKIYSDGDVETYILDR